MILPAWHLTAKSSPTMLMKQRTLGLIQLKPLEINFFNGYIDADGDGGGTVFICGGRLTSDSSYVYASTKGKSQTTSGNGIDIQISGEVVVDNSACTGSVIGPTFLTISIPIPAV